MALRVPTSTLPDLEWSTYPADQEPCVKETFKIAGICPGCGKTHYVSSRVDGTIIRIQCTLCNSKFEIRAGWTCDRCGAKRAADTEGKMYCVNCDKPSTIKVTERTNMIRYDAGDRPHTKWSCRRCGARGKIYNIDSDSISRCQVCGYDTIYVAEYHIGRKHTLEHTTSDGQMIDNKDLNRDNKVISIW